MSEEQQHLNALPEGHRLQEYELVRVLGMGGFGITYLGFDDNLDKGVAIKEYLPSDLATRTADSSIVPQASQFRDYFQWGLERFLDEARALARFDHRHIIKVHRFFEAHGTAYIVMEYAEGETLADYLERKKTLTEAELKAVLYPILAGLAVVHEANFLHRDIKPGNIVIRDADDSPVLLGFGAARQAIGTKSRPLTSILTPGYAPIEQYHSESDDQIEQNSSKSAAQGAWTDLYALGAVCYQALTGQMPAEATKRVRHDPLVPVSQRCAGQASQAFLSAIDGALSVWKEDRPQDVAAWQGMLKLERQRQEDQAVLKEAGVDNLHDAAVWNTSAAAAVLLRQGANVHAKDNMGRTPLHRAAYHRYHVDDRPLRKASAKDPSAVAEMLLRQGADVNAKDNMGETPLHGAAWNSDSAVAAVLLRQGANVHAKDNDGKTPLRLAVEWDKPKIAELLRRYGGRE